jgi:hypothetical protein
VARRIGRSARWFVKRTRANGNGEPNAVWSALVPSLHISSNVAEKSCNILVTRGRHPNLLAGTQPFRSLGECLAHPVIRKRLRVGRSGKRHGAVSRHKGAMLEHLVLFTAREFAKEANMTDRVRHTAHAIFVSQRKNIHATAVPYATLALILH